MDVRLSAVSSRLGPLSPAAMSSLAFWAGFAYSRKERTSAAVAIPQRTIAPIAQPCQGRSSGRKIAVQTPRLMVPTRPITIAAVADHDHPVEVERRLWEVDRSHRDYKDPGHDKSPDERGRGQQVKGEDPVLEAHTVERTGRHTH